MLAAILAAVAVNTLLVAILLYEPPPPRRAWISIKYVAVDEAGHVEFIDRVWINGAVDYNNRPFCFKPGDVVNFTCPLEVVILGRRFRFAGWQLEEAPHQGWSTTSRSLIIVVDGDQTWWANYFPAC